ncbi:SGNH/GDSL hydrolase family protein [Sorangium sp. So ce362]|uniref:SGNH/GDSL hydrolase family protein n=1 Tax=Sorangium sp. So ce362 TaxID=3133303 RepID=UPI003F5F9ED4
MPVRRLKLSSSAVLACVVLLVAACSEGADSPGGTASTASAGTTSGSGTAAGGGGSPGSSGSSATSGGAANAGAGGTAGGGAGGAGSGGMGGVSDGGGGTAGNGGDGGGSAGAGGGPAFQPCPASGSCKVMPFGDSITQGFNVAGGYRAPLFHLALEANRDITFVGSANDYSVPMVDGVTFPRNHEGHGGWTIEGNNGIAQLVGTSIPNYKPNIITLMIGTNDINGNINLADAPNRLGKLLDSIFMRDPNILVVLAQIVPTRTDGTNNTIKTYNAAMPDLVSTRVSKGQHIVLVDMYTAFTNDANYKQSLFADNLHPNQAGYNRMADVWFEALSPYLR